MFRDLHLCVLGKLLEGFLLSSVDCKRERGIDALVEFGHVWIDISLRDLEVSLVNVTDEIPDGHIIEAFIGVIKLSIVDRFDGMP